MLGEQGGAAWCCCWYSFESIRGESAILTVGRHHHHTPSSEGLGHHLAAAGLTAADPAHPALVDAS